MGIEKRKSRRTDVNVYISLRQLDDKYVSGYAGDVAPHCTEVNQQVTRENNKNAVDREQHSNADPPFCFLTVKKNGKQNRQCRP